MKSGIAARLADGDVSSSYALISGTIGRLPSMKNAIIAMPPSSAKIGAPSDAGDEDRHEPRQERAPFEATA